MNLKYGKSDIEFGCYTVAAQTHMDYNGCLPEDDDILNHIRIPRLYSMYAL